MNYFGTLYQMKQIFSLLRYKASSEEHGRLAHFPFTNENFLAELK